MPQVPLTAEQLTALANARTALQLAAFRFGQGGNDETFAGLLAAFDDYRFVESVIEEPGVVIAVTEHAIHPRSQGTNTKVDQPCPCGSDHCDLATISDLAGETLLTIPATLRDESHAEVGA